MGSLSRYSLSQTNCNVFVETGTGKGASLKHAILSNNFNKFYSIEIHPETAKLAQINFKKYSNLEIINNDSEN